MYGCVPSRQCVKYSENECCSVVLSFFFWDLSPYLALLDQFQASVVVIVVVADSAEKWRIACCAGLLFVATR